MRIRWNKMRRFIVIVVRVEWLVGDLFLVVIGCVNFKCNVCFREILISIRLFGYKERYGFYEII